MKNKIITSLALVMGKFVLFSLKQLKKGGTALPGKVALTIDSSFLEEINERCDVIVFITGTNGKTTTNNLINHVFQDFNLLSNLKGANMVQGVATTYIRNTQDHYDFGIFEVDEGSLDRVSKYIKPDYIILTNFFRDQLDRYGEIEGIIDEVLEDIKLLPDTKLIINADDPYVYQFSKKLDNEMITYGLDIASNDIIESNLTIKKCPLCGSKIEYSKHTYGHLGDYNCSSCGLNNKNKKYIVSNIKEEELSQTITIKLENKEYTIHYPYNGIYNAYNVCGVFAIVNELGMDKAASIVSMENFSFSLGRMEKFDYNGKKIQVILTKNPIGLSQATRIISEDTRNKTIVHVLNDNSADGRDISWIWDANTYCTNDETINNYYCSGIRAQEIALKKKYDDVPLEKIHIIQGMKDAVDTAIEDDVEIVYVLPTYTAVFEARDYISKIVHE